MSFDPHIQGNSSAPQSHVEDMFALYGNQGSGQAGPVLNRAASAAQTALNVEPIDPNAPPKPLQGRVSDNLQKGSVAAQNAMKKQETMAEFKKDVGTAKYNEVNKYRLAHDDQIEITKALQLQGFGMNVSGGIAVLALALLIAALALIIFAPAGVAFVAATAAAVAGAGTTALSQGVSGATSASDKSSEKLTESEKYLREKDTKEMRDLTRRFDQANRLTAMGRVFSPEKRKFDNVTELTGIDADNPDGKNPSGMIDDLHKSVTDAIPEPKRQRVVKQMPKN